MVTPDPSPETPKTILTIKAQFEGDTRRFIIPGFLDWPEFEATLREVYGTPADQPLQICFQDEDQDWCTIASEREMRYAFNLAYQNNHLLRLRLTRRMPPPHSSPVSEIREPDLPDGPIHSGIVCAVCQRPISGIRFKCLSCSNTDLCQACEKKGVHNRRHMLVKIIKPLAADERVVSVEPSQQRYSSAALASPPCDPLAFENLLMSVGTLPNAQEIFQGLQHDPHYNLFLAGFPALWQIWERYKTFHDQTAAPPHPLPILSVFVGPDATRMPSYLEQLAPYPLLSRAIVFVKVMHPDAEKLVPLLMGLCSPDDLLYVDQLLGHAHPLVLFNALRASNLLPAGITNYFMGMSTQLPNIDELSGLFHRCLDYARAIFPPETLAAAAASGVHASPVPVHAAPDPAPSGAAPSSGASSSSSSGASSSSSSSSSSASSSTVSSAGSTTSSASSAAIPVPAASAASPAPRSAIPPAGPATGPLSSQQQQQQRPDSGSLPPAAGALHRAPLAGLGQGADPGFPGGLTLGTSLGASPELPSSFAQLFGDPNSPLAGLLQTVSSVFGSPPAAASGPSVPEQELEEKCALLVRMGFADADRNRRVLLARNGVLNVVLEDLRGQEPTSREVSETPDEKDRPAEISVFRFRAEEDVRGWGRWQQIGFDRPFGQLVELRLRLPEHQNSRPILRTRYINHQMKTNET
ncbi:hypothetical protein PAPYR_5369 [Paratrimastix pyriformis]|uniref:ZZ-type domain-containing protein n=1 Tax=Paratrimastix pyriformis TaxID=342808 RepID=A0ABQ8UK99_9EUKA|nr:hypothetical protein PAPYR_5369 [Paratrimastix pyriformis]